MIDLPIKTKVIKLLEKKRKYLWFDLNYTKISYRTQKYESIKNNTLSKLKTKAKNLLLFQRYSSGNKKASHTLAEYICKTSMW